MSTPQWPRPWVGTWLADDGRTVVIRWADGGPAVTVQPGPDLPAYRSAALLRGGTKAIERLPARCRIDDKDRLFLEIEAGTDDLGPTYRLYAGFSQDDLPVRDVVLLPEVSIGLYDDFDDDLGVPWAYPLLPLRWQGP